MIEYRRIGKMDVGALTEFAIGALPEHLGMKVSRLKVRDTVSFFATTPGHYQMATFKDGRPVAGIAVFVQEMPFHEGREGVVMFCLSKHPGAGLRLLRGAVEWVNAEPEIRRLQWSQNALGDLRTQRIANRCGLDRGFDTFMKIQGVA